MFHSQPVPEELQNGESFGYIIAFRAFGEVSWTHVATSAPGASRYVYRNDSIAPFSPFHVKVGTYNIKGQGPFSPVVTIYSAEIGKGTKGGWDLIDAAQLFLVHLLHWPQRALTCRKINKSFHNSGKKSRK